MKYSGLVLASILSLLAAGCFEKAAPGEVPTAFYYKGKPIDPYCLTGNVGIVGDGTVSLDVCSKKTKSPPFYNENKFYGVSIEDMSGALTTPYIFYKYLGKKGDGHVLQVVSSTGGTGQFSELRVVSLEDNLMHTETSLAGGDRCNGAIADASVSGGRVHYSKNITPFDLITLSNGNAAGFEANEDIKACATCCVGTADYEGGEMESVTLTKDPSTVVIDDLNQKDSCFHATYAETYKKGRTLDHDRLKAFGDAFNSRCAQLK